MKRYESIAERLQLPQPHPEFYRTLGSFPRAVPYSPYDSRDKEIHDAKNYSFSPAHAARLRHVINRKWDFYDMVKDIDRKDDDRARSALVRQVRRFCVRKVSCMCTNTATQRLSEDDDMALPRTSNASRQKAARVKQESDVVQDHEGVRYQQSYCEFCTEDRCISQPSSLLPRHKRSRQNS